MAKEMVALNITNSCARGLNSTTSLCYACEISWQVTKMVKKVTETFMTTHLQNLISSSCLSKRQI